MSAPALERGIQVLQNLSDGKSLRLEELARLTEVPKASLLRICDTLEAQGILERDAQTKLYSARMRLVPMGSEGVSFEARVHQTLEKLAERTGQTAEWYAPREEGMVILDRMEPRDALVRVHAQIGFTRAWEGELDCVGALGYAASGRSYTQLSVPFWDYTDEGKRVPLSPEAVTTKIDTARTGMSLEDTIYNSNGVRRIGAAVLDGARFVGVLAIAQTYTPDADALLPQRLAAVQEEARALCVSAFGVAVS